MKEYNVAVLGATGAVGREMIKVLEERAFPVKRLLPLASARSAGKTIAFRGEQVAIEEAKETSFEGMDIVLGAVSNAHAQAFAPHILQAGAVFIDNSSAFRLRDDVPLVVPEINPQDIALHHGIIANPNCSTIISMVALSGVARLTPIDTLVACTYQAVSGAGQGGIEELEGQLQAYAQGAPLEHKTFPCQILSNVIPQIGSRLDNGYTTEEMKMQNEGRKILHLRARAGHALALDLAGLHHPRGDHPRAGRAGRRSGPGLPLHQRPRPALRPLLPHPARHHRPGSGVRRPHPPRPDPRQRPVHVVLRRPDPQGRGHQRRADRPGLYRLRKPAASPKSVFRQFQAINPRLCGANARFSPAKR